MSSDGSQLIKIIINLINQFMIQMEKLSLMIRIICMILFINLFSCVNNENKEKINNNLKEVLETKTESNVLAGKLHKYIQTLNALNEQSEIPDFIINCSDELKDIQSKNILTTHNNNDDDSCYFILIELLSKINSNKLILLEKKLNNKENLSKNEETVINLIKAKPWVEGNILN